MEESTLVLEQTHQLSEHQPHLQKEDTEEPESTSIQQQQQSRRPNLSSLEIPSRSIENALPSFTRIDIPSPSSARAGLPPRPHSTKLRPSMRNLVFQKSLIKEKNSVQEGEKAVLIVPDTPPSDKPTTSRSCSLNKVLFSTPPKSAHSLPVTPFANSGIDRVQERQLDHDSSTSHHMTRSLSVPINGKLRSLKRMDSMGGLIRVISATPRSTLANSTSLDISEAETVKMLLRIYRKRKQFVEFVSLSLGKEVKLLSWSAAVKESLHLLTEIVLLSGLALKETKLVMFASKMFETFQ